MKTISIFTFTLFSCILVCLPASAYWPVNLYDFLPVAAAQDTSEFDCNAVPFTDGSILVIFRKSYYGVCYQIVDRYGELVYDCPQFVIPEFPIGSTIRLLEDDEGGVFVVYKSITYNLNLTKQFTTNYYYIT